MTHQVLLVEDQQKWDQFIKSSASFGLLQSWGWGKFKQSMGWKVFRVAVMEDGAIQSSAQLLIKSLPGKITGFAYIPRGPLTDWSDKETTSLLLEKIHQIARQEHAVFLKIEPPLPVESSGAALMQEYHFKQSPVTNQPRNTIIIDIRPDPEELLAQMRQKTRQYIRRAGREGITVRYGGESDLQSFIQLMKSTGKRVGFPVRSRRYYSHEFAALNIENQFVLLLAEKEGKLLAARTVHAFGGHAAEFHAGSVENADNLHPNYLLVWEGILWARRMGCTSYDMWGIPDEIHNGHAEENGNGNGHDDQPNPDRVDGLWGVYRFKRGFSSNVVSFAGAFDYVYSPVPYFFYATRLLNRESVEKIAIWTESLKKNNGH